MMLCEEPSHDATSIDSSSSLRLLRSATLTPAPSRLAAKDVASYPICVSAAVYFGEDATKLWRLVEDESAAAAVAAYDDSRLLMAVVFASTASRASSSPVLWAISASRASHAVSAACDMLRPRAE